MEGVERTWVLCFALTALGSLPPCRHFDGSVRPIVGGKVGRHAKLQKVQTRKLFNAFF